MPVIRTLCITSLCVASAWANAASVRLQVEGLSGELQKNVRAQLSTIQSDEVTPDRRFQARVDDAIRAGLKALGYYEPTINFTLKPPPQNGGRQVLLAQVDAGQPVLIGGTDVILRGGARTDKDYLALLPKRPKIGTVLDHADYDNFKKASPVLRCVRATSTVISAKANWAFLWTDIRRSGISTMTAASATALAR